MSKNPKARPSLGKSQRKPGQVSLERALSKLGVASRTQAREWIQAGRVVVNGKQVLHPGFPVNPEKARIEVDNARVGKAQRIVLLLNKPTHCVTTRSDEKGRKTVFDFLPERYTALGHLHAVGRLDWATTGLLILTNDTQLSSALTDPAFAVERVYLVEVRGEITVSHISQILSGLKTEIGTVQAKKVELLKASQRESRVLVTLEEGKNREIRRIFEALGSEVTRLKRVSYGPFELGALTPGEVREATEAEIAAALRLLGARDSRFV